MVREGKYSTGLSRQDYFDWPAQLEKLVGKYNPDMVVICMGANDPQDIIDENRKRHHADSESWKTIYRSRAERLLAVATAKGAKAVWVGLPVMGKEPYSTRVRRLSELQKEACETYHAAFVDTVKVLADAQGNYTTFKVDDKGRHIRLRYKDMVHVTEDGGAMLSAAVEPVVEKELLLGRNKAAERPAPQALPSSASSSPLPAESLCPPSLRPLRSRAAFRSLWTPCSVEGRFLATRSFPPTASRASVSPSCICCMVHSRMRASGTRGPERCSRSWRPASGWCSSRRHAAAPAGMRTAPI